MMRSRRLAKTEDDYRRAREARPPAEMREHITSLVANLPCVWHVPRTPSRERKRILRPLIEDVMLVRDEMIRIVDSCT
jgi:hypothetical protein